MKQLSLDEIKVGMMVNPRNILREGIRLHRLAV